MNKATKSQKTDNKTAKIAGILVLLAVVILVILLLLRGCGSKGAELPAQPETGTGISYDSAAVVGGWDEADMDKIVEGLNEQVEAGMINISMNTSPVFSDGTSEGNLMIVNEGVNRYPQIVEITRNDTGETIYKHFVRAIEAAGLPHMRFHDLRHLSASVLVSLGIPNLYSRERGGWSTDSILESVYQHTFSADRAAVDTKVNSYFEELLSPKTDT